jgi:WD40 repeat protein
VKILIPAIAMALSMTACGASPPPDANGEPSASASRSVSTGTPPGEDILFSRIMPTGETLYFVVSADGSGETPFAPGKDFEGRQLSPDGSQLAIVGPNEEGVLVGGTVGVDGSGFRLFAAPDPTLHLACGVWAPQGRMACEGWDDSDPSRAGIYTVRASDGGDPQRLTRHRDVPCEYSPDGTQLAFVRTGANDAVGTLMLMDADGGRRRAVLTDVALSGIPCDWSPDGHSILVASGSGALIVVTPDGDDSPIEGDGLKGHSLGAVWSLDGSHILFSMRLEGDQFDVYMAAADGSDLTRITDSDLLEEATNWLP